MLVIYGKQNMFKILAQCENIFKLNIGDSRMTSSGSGLFQGLLQFKDLLAWTVWSVEIEQ